MKAADIIFNEINTDGGIVAQVILNRPTKLNVITVSMCKDFVTQLTEWGEDDRVAAVIISGGGDRAFCAGGDVRKLYQYREHDSELLNDFFCYEYQLNKLIHHFPKPYIAILDGITMGGGAGIAIHGSHRITTERLRFAMPETKIGFFPDVGGSYFLNQCPGYCGLYLALSGNPIDATTAHHWGLITHRVPGARLQLLTSQLIYNPAGQGLEAIDKFLLPYTRLSQTFELEPWVKVIDECFSASSVEAIIQRLAEHDDHWCHRVGRQLQTRAPMSLVVAFEAYYRAQHMSFDDIMEMEFRITQQFIKEDDFFSGVQAIVIDKKGTPTWNPSSLSDIDQDRVAKYFAAKPQTLP